MMLFSKAKKRINWKDVENYLKEYINDFYEVLESGDVIYIGKDLPKEYSYSEYTKKLIRSSSKIKANLSQAIPELIKIASNRKYKDNNKTKHLYTALYGWYKYDTRFAFPVFNDAGDLIRYNIYKAILLVRISEDKKLYLYDVTQIFKEK